VRSACAIIAEFLDFLLLQGLQPLSMELIAVEVGWLEDVLRFITVESVEPTAPQTGHA
jgi:hypothetical protein